MIKAKNAPWQYLNAGIRIRADKRLAELGYPNDVYCQSVAPLFGVQDAVGLSELMFTNPEIIQAVKLLGGPHAGTIYKMLLARQKAATD